MTNKKIVFPNEKLSQNLPDIPPFGIGTWAWGNSFYWDWGSKKFDQGELFKAFAYCIKHGITFFDTAEVYSQGRSEKTLGRLVERQESNFLIATKFFPFPWRSSAAFRRALKGSLKRLNLPAVDLYQMHWPLPVAPIETWMNLMADAVEDGLVRAVGVSNYNLEQTERAYHALDKRGIKLASNQILYNLLHRNPEFNGLFDLCRQVNVKIISYSPLAQGLLTGKYGPQKPPPGIRGIRTSKKMLNRLQGLLDALESIAATHQRTPSQVALNWAICKGTIPIPGIKSLKQAIDNLETLEWRLNPAEIADLDQISQGVR